MKRRHATGSRPKLLTFADFLKLQNEADKRIGPPKVHRELERADRAKLKNLPVSSGRVDEGSFVKVVGFITARPAPPHATSRESVNCRLSRQINNDFHISLVQRAGDSEFSGIVVEMIPQRRPLGWVIPKLKRIGTRKVLITGALFYDNEHIINENPAKSIGGQPKRFSIWEIHPIKEFFVCEEPDNGCDPNQIRQWTKLADFQPN